MGGAAEDCLHISINTMSNIWLSRQVMFALNKRYRQIEHHHSNYPKFTAIQHFP